MITNDYLTIAPSIPDESTADRTLTELLQSDTEKPTAFSENPTVKDLMRPLPKFTPINVPIRIGRPCLPKD